MKIENNILRSRSGFSLAELLIAMLIGAVLLLTVGVISRISIATQAKYYNDTQIHADISYGFKLMRTRVRQFGFVIDAPAGSWLSERVRAGNGTFGVYQNADLNTKDFVYVPNIGNEAIREVILSVPNAETINFTVTPEADVPPRKVTVQIDGEKKGIPFNMVMTVTKRGS